MAKNDVPAAEQAIKAEIKPLSRKAKKAEQKNLLLTFVKLVLYL